MDFLYPSSSCDHHLPSQESYMLVSYCDTAKCNIICCLLTCLTASRFVCGWQNNCICKKPLNLPVADELWVIILVLNEIVSYCCGSVEGWVCVFKIMLAYLVCVCEFNYIMKPASSILTVARLVWTQNCFWLCYSRA